MSEQATQQEQKAQEAAARLLALYAAYQAGQIVRPDFVAQGAGIVYAAKITASALADIAVSMVANVAPLGIRPGPRHLDRLSEALSTITDPEPAEDVAEPETDAEEPLEGIPARLERLTIAEALTSQQKTTRAAIAEHGFPGFREQVAADACEKCQPFRDALHDSEEDWSPHHPGCRCELVPDGTPTTPEREEPAPLVRMTREVLVR